MKKTVMASLIGAALFVGSLVALSASWCEPLGQPVISLSSVSGSGSGVGSINLSARADAAAGIQHEN